MNKKAFTLIELMAIITILGLLLVLIVPKVKDILNNSKEQISYESTKKMVNIFDEYYTRMRLKGDFQGCYYDFSSNNTDCDDFSFDGKGPDSGKLTLSKDGRVDGNLFFEDADIVYYVVDNKVSVDSVIGIEIASLPSQMLYNVGEELNVEGLKVITNWTSGVQKEVADYTITFDSSSKGEKEVVIEYMGYSASFNVDVANIKYLYKNGDLCSDITGGWTNNIGTRNSYWYNYNATFNSDHILLKEENYYSDWAQSATRTQNMIDFSLYDELYVDFYIDGPIEYHFFGQISSSTSLDYTEFLVFTASGKDSEGRYTRSANISNYNSSAYLKLNLMTGVEHPTVAKNNLKLYNVYLVKK